MLRCNKTFDSTSADMLVRGWRDIFAMSKPGNPVYLTAKRGFPTTFAFKTREGGMGVLQIVEVQAHEYTRIRYKLLDDGLAAGHVQGVIVEDLALRFLAAIR